MNWAHDGVSRVVRWLSGPPRWRIYGKASHESVWHVIHLYATPRRDADSRWPLWGNTCITWTSSIIAVGVDFAELLENELRKQPVTRDRPCAVIGGRLDDPERRRHGRGPSIPYFSEVIAHECGHTAQARRLGAAYWPVVGALTLAQEGRGWIHHFENQASETGLFGGIVET